MDIGFDAKRAFLNRTGLGNYSRFIISGLLDMYPENEYSLYTPGRKTDVKFGTGAEIISAPSYFPGRTAAIWRSYFLSTALKKRKIDLFHGLSNELPAGILKTGAASVVTIHDLIFLRYPQYYRSYDRAIYRKKFLSSCQKADLIISVSCQTKEDLVNFFHIKPDRIEVVYQDCDAAFQSHPGEETLKEVKRKYSLPDSFLLTLGTVEERKNQLLILKALKLLKDQSVTLVISGKQTAYFKELSAYIEENQLADRVKFLDYVDFKDLPALYVLSSAFVYPSVFEGFGIPVLEAMNLGVPVITSAGTCMQEVGGDAAIYIDPLKEDELAHEINRVLSDSLLKEQMTFRGKQQALLFRKEVVIPQTMEIYKRLVGK